MAKRINMINEALGDVQLSPAEERTLLWLCEMWETSTVKHIISAFKKAKAAALWLGNGFTISPVPDR